MRLKLSNLAENTKYQAIVFVMHYIGFVTHYMGATVLHSMIFPIPNMTRITYSRDHRHNY
jgi:hypothetical protein